jgi:hypothetical protein
MARSEILAEEIEVGDALKKELFDKIKNNDDDHETRLAQLETVAKKVEVFKQLVLNAASANTMTGLAYYKADEAFTLTSATITIFEKGSLTGALEIDIKKSTTNLDSASFTSVFTTKPKITWASASDYAESSNQVFDNNKIDIEVGDYLRFDVTEMPASGILGKFILNVYGEIS